MSPTLVSTLTLVLLSHTHNVFASWAMSADTLVTSRMDPLVSPNGVASHVHTVVGGNNFASTYDYNTLRQSTCSSVEVQDDKSNYWAPHLYYKHRDSGKFELVPTRGYAVYYLHRGDEEIHQFPEGFRMIAGNAAKRVLTGDPSEQAFTFHCLDQDNQETLYLPKRPCPAGIRIQVLFPSCWNGVDATSPNFKNHVSYPVGVREAGTCPPTHPVRIMTVFLEQFAETGKFEYYEGGFVLSTGDNVGYSSHADFQNGWDVSPNSVLQQAINTCKNTQASLKDCDVLMKSVSPTFRVCRPNKPLPVEDVGFFGLLDKLPGDNPVWGGDVPKVLTGVSNTPPYGSAISTLPAGWKKHGCVDEGNPGTNSLTADTFVDPNMYPGLCVQHCDSKGFTLAGLEAGTECRCANQLTNGGSMNLVTDDKCDAVCPGSLYELCGGGRKVTLYQKTGDPAATGGDSPFPPVGSRLTKVYTDNGHTTPVLVANPGTNSTSTISSPPTNSTPMPAAVSNPPMNPPMNMTSANTTSNGLQSSGFTSTTSPPSPSTLPGCNNQTPKRELVEAPHIPAKGKRHVHRYMHRHMHH